MQSDAALQGHPLEVVILGTNGIGHEDGNAANCAGRVIPWLQDEPAMSVWGLWKVTYRDVIIIDDENKFVAVYNLTEHDLSVPANYDTLLGMLIAASDP